MSKTTKSGAFPRNRVSGFTLVELMFVMLITAALLGTIFFSAQKMIDRSHDTKAAELEASFNNWYGDWTHAGGQHTSSPANSGTMAMTLLTLAFSAPNEAALTYGQRTLGPNGTDWTDESKNQVKGKSLAGSLRIDNTVPFVMDPTNSFVVYNNAYRVEFNATSTNTGRFTVSYIP